MERPSPLGSLLRSPLLRSVLRSGGLGLLLAGAVLVARSVWGHATADCTGLSTQECALDQELLDANLQAMRFLGLALVLAGVAVSWAARLLNVSPVSTTKIS